MVLLKKLPPRCAVVRFIRESITVDRGGGSLMGLMLSILAAFAQFERDVIADRQPKVLPLQSLKYRRSLKCRNVMRAI